MLKLTCYVCEQAINISNENLYNKVAIQCPNCDNPLPVNAVEALRRYSEAYLDLIDVLYHENSTQQAWGVSVLSNDQLIPEKPDYFFGRPGEDDSYWTHRKKPVVRRAAFEDLEDIDF
ncbi:hypothetical protein [Sporosarcina newyorkensis]|uniref:hypothetical protein n=1 Tax=Sporosarcina newyorkensis TaxID=759851 RepID=UPI003D066343